MSCLDEKFSLILNQASILRRDEDLAQIQFNTGELKDSVEIATSYGFSSAPPKGSECLVVSPGARKKAVVIAALRQKHPELKEGETCIFSGKNFLKVGESFVEIRTKKFSVKNEKVDLMLIIEELLSVLAKTTVMTEDGPKPLSSMAQILALKQKWGLFCDRS